MNYHHRRYTPGPFTPARYRRTPVAAWLLPLLLMSAVVWLFAVIGAAYVITGN